jgi:hypothetical protein
LLRRCGGKKNESEDTEEESKNEPGIIVATFLPSKPGAGAPPDDSPEEQDFNCEALSFPTFSSCGFT